MEMTKVTEEDLAELGLSDLSLNDKAADDDLWATPMVSDESNESYFTDDETTMNMSFQSAMRQADRAEGMTPFKDIPEHLIERTQTGKVINVRPPSPNSPTSTLKRRVKDLEDELHNKEDQTARRKQEYQERLTSLETRLFELEQQRGYLESTAEEWKVKYEKQRELAEEYLKMVDDREMEGHLAVSELNESMSEESAERSRHIAELKDECDSLKLKVTETETKRDEYATKLAEVTQRLLTNTTEVFKLRNDLKLRDENIGTLQKESYDHQRRADEAAKVAKDLRDLTATEGVRLKNEIRQVMQENKVLKEDNKKVTDEIKELKEAAKTIAEQGKRWEHEAHLLDEKVTVLELKDKEWQQTVHQKTQEIIKLNTELIDMTQTAMTREDEVNQTKTQLKAAADEYSKLERDVTQLAEHIRKVENDTEKVIQDKTLQLHQQMSKVNQENQNLKNEKEQSDLRIKRLEDENKALQMSNKHKDEQLLQHGVTRRRRLPGLMQKKKVTFAPDPDGVDYPERGGDTWCMYETIPDDEWVTEELMANCIFVGPKRPKGYGMVQQDKAHKETTKGTEQEELVKEIVEGGSNETEESSRKVEPEKWKRPQSQESKKLEAPDVRCKEYSRLLKEARITFSVTNQTVPIATHLVTLNQSRKMRTQLKMKKTQMRKWWTNTKKPSKEATPRKAPKLEEAMNREKPKKGDFLKKRREAEERKKKSGDESESTSTEKKKTEGKKKEKPSSHDVEILDESVGEVEERSSTPTTSKKVIQSATSKAKVTEPESPKPKAKVIAVKQVVPIVISASTPKRAQG
ncbi:putative leucine-rich repeat-containing protein DDB_G0290503 [Paramacrobiotus metropolitanus]|uniref:putative leucine-rich repeat-containing protein DDB_G0290503 n=1 Tax=Paramacrobiotus metropolitanus TaxID=2943436 RepID=UPI0024463537|nr:putative leucine-rich repeat-containing protein DDB_G0290503 [Paramacrobiotus metropolitanus]